MKSPNVFARRVGRVSLGGWLRLFFVVVVGGAILSYVSPGKTNRSYLKEIIATGSVEKAAGGFVDAMKKTNKAPSYSEAEWERVKYGLSQCMTKEANVYLSAADPYLDARADKESPRLLAARFLKACGATE